jgi:orotate phosphoribosyltransferase-like protein
MLMLSFASVYFDERALISMLSQVWTLPFLLALWKLPANTNKWTMYGILTTAMSFPNPHAIQVSWCSINSNTVGTRTVSAAMYNMFVQASAIISSYIYRDDDKPLCIAFVGIPLIMS